MANLLIQNIPDELMSSLKDRASQNGRSPEEEALFIFESSLGASSRSWVYRLRLASIAAGGFDMEPPIRHAPRDLDMNLFE